MERISSNSKAMSAAEVRSVLILHNAYQQRGGEDNVVEHEVQLLRDAGLNVSVKLVSNDQIVTPTGKLAVAFGASGNSRMANQMVEAAREAKADVVHIHNFWPLITPATHYALSRAGFPVIQTLHNYRLLCANAMLMRGGQVCEDCVTGSRLNSLRHKCYRNSWVGTTASLAMQNATIRDPQWVGSVARFIVLTEFARAKFVEQGIPSDRITVKGNSLADPLASGKEDQKRAGFLFVGRIAEGKGVDLLMSAARELPDSQITIIGGGPLRSRLEAEAPPNARFLGQVPREEVFAAMSTTQWLVLPSTWYEGFPVALVEALAHGLPAIVPQIGGLPDLIGQGQAGLLFKPGSAGELGKTMAKATSEPQMGQQKSIAARDFFEVNFGPEKDRERLLSIYRGAMAAVSGQAKH